MNGIRQYISADNGVEIKGGDISRFIRPDPVPEDVSKVERVSLARRLWNKVRRT